MAASYADNTETNNCQTVMGDMRNLYSTVCMRRQFTISSAVKTNQHLVLTMDYDDGYIAWLDGVYLTSGNITSAIKGLCFNPEERTARFKKYRLLLVHLAGRMSRFQCKLRLRFRASKEAIDRAQKVWAVFALPTQATAFT